MSGSDIKKSKTKKDDLFGDIELWEKVKASTKPLKNKKSKTSSFISSNNKNHKKPWELPSGMAPLSLHAFGEKIYKKTSLQNKELYLGDLTQMDKRNAERLKKGRLNFDGRIDLHGFTTDQAWHALKNFILFSYKANRRCVLVITGKGWKSKTGIGVLRSHVPKWLNNPEIQHFILGFSRAQDKDGGDGAFYIMLRRNRNKK